MAQQGQIKTSVIVNTGRGKKAAIRAGIQKANTKWVVTTDADVHFPEKWLESMGRCISRHADGTVGAIAVSNAAGVQVMSQPFATTTVTSQLQVPTVPTQLPAASVQDLYGDISTVLPSSPSQRQEESGGDTDAQQQAPQDQEVPLEGAEIEGEEDALAHSDVRL